MASKERPNGYWTYERCYEEAKKYVIKNHFRKGSRGAYDVAVKNGWFSDYTWFFNKIEANSIGQLYRNNTKEIKWTYEKCMDAARQCNTCGEFQKKFKGAYSAAYKHDWIKEYTWFTRKTKPKGYWDNYDNCIEEAIKYKTRNCFRLGSYTAYRAAKRNNWLDEWFDETNRKHVDDEYLVYAYEDKTNKVAYVGLTLINRFKRRQYEHKTDDDSVHSYFGNNVPTPEVKKDYLYAEEAQYYEDWYKVKYTESGWKVLNIAPTGVGISSLGGSIKKWTYETCFEEAIKYSTKEEFHRGNGGAYAAAKEHKWLIEWFGEYDAKPNGYWNNYDRCKEAAEQCRTRSEFQEKFSRAYWISIQNGWINDFEFEEIRKPKGYWNYDTCKEEAMKYKSKKAFAKGCGSAYNLANKNKWIDDWFVNIQKPKGYWNYDTCKEEAMKYETRSQFQQGSSMAYKVSVENKWIDSFTWFKILKQKLTFQECLEESKKYDTRGKFQKFSKNAYQASWKNGWLDEFFPKDNKK